MTTHDALGYYARRYGIRVVGAVIPSRSTRAQPSAGEIAALVDTIRREGVQAIFAESSVNARRRGGDRARVRRARRRARCGPTRWGRRARTARPTSTRSPRTPRALVDGFSGGAIACRPEAVMLDLSRPYIQRALLEMLLLAVPGRAARELDRAAPARVLHPRGRHRRASPALVLASAWGIAPQLAALAAALGFGVAQERLARSRRLRADAATGLLLVGALAAGVVLASDVFESGAEVDTLLFGSLIGLERDATCG